MDSDLKNGLGIPPDGMLVHHMKPLSLINLYLGENQTTQSNPMPNMKEHMQNNN